MEKVVLVTGGARRIGAAICTYLHQLGYRVVIHYRRSGEQAGELRDTLNRRRPNSAVVIRYDFANTQGLQAFCIQVLAAFGRLDAVIHNASSFYTTPLEDITPDQWHELMQSNAQAPLFLSQELSAELKRTRGSIVTLLDIHGERPLKHHIIYCMAKSALQMMTLGLAVELAPEVRVNGIAPGPILWPEHALDPIQQQRVIDTVPLKRLGDPEAIARSVAFLLTEDYLTGTILNVDGGRNIRPLVDA